MAHGAILLYLLELLLQYYFEIMVQAKLISPMNERKLPFEGFEGKIPFS